VRTRPRTKILASRPGWPRGLPRGQVGLEDLTSLHRSRNSDINSLTHLLYHSHTRSVNVCLTVDVSCNFESSLCGWSSVGQLDHSLGTELADLQWTIVSRRSSTASTGPATDHSSTDSSKLPYHVLTIHQSK